MKVMGDVEFSILIKGVSVGKIGATDSNGIKILKNIVNTHEAKQFNHKQIRELFKIIAKAYPSGNIEFKYKYLQEVLKDLDSI